MPKYAKLPAYGEPPFPPNGKTGIVPRFRRWAGHLKPGPPKHNLLTLPREIRDLIYDEILKDLEKESGDWISMYGDNYYSSWCWDEWAADVFEINRQLRDEMVPYLFSKIRWKFSTHGLASIRHEAYYLSSVQKAFYEWLGTLDWDMVTHIRYLSIDTEQLCRRNSRQFTGLYHIDLKAGTVTISDRSDCFWHTGFNWSGRSERLDKELEATGGSLEEELDKELEATRCELLRHVRPLAEQRQQGLLEWDGLQNMIRALYDYFGEPTYYSC